MSYFVTGATGFIGRHLVELLLQREGTVYALVREGSRGRLDDLSKRLGAGDRLVPVPGDLSQEKLGIDGLDEPLHEVERLLLADLLGEAGPAGQVREGDRHPHPPQVDRLIEVGLHVAHHVLPHAYHRTKFESEKVVREGIKAPLRVYRPGIVVGHSQTGEMDKVDGPYYFFKLIQRLRHALPEWFPVVGPEGKKVNIVPVDFVARALDHIAHLPADELPGDTFHLTEPDPLTVGQVLNEFAKAAHAPRFAMRVDAHLTNVIPKPVAAGLNAIPTVAKIRETVLRDLHIPPAALENRDFDADFDMRDTQRALRGTGIAVPPLSTYATKLWDYWERNLDPDLFRERSLTKSVDGKRILVTGASSGIGRELALKLGEAGAEVILVSRTREKLEEVAEEMEKLGGKPHVHPADLSDIDDIERLANEMIDEYGGVDVLVNNAGRSIRRSVKASYDRFHDYERTMQLNYFGALRLILSFLPGMRERKAGHIINVSSIGVQTNTPRFSAYVASKAALDAFARCVAPEVIGDGVHITTIYMPLVRTPMIAPTNIYDAFPTLTPDEAAQMICDAIIDKPKRLATRLGTFGQVLYAVSPKVVDQVMHTAYTIFPDSKAARGKKKPSAEAGDGKPEKQEEMSTEAIAMAYLMRGVHF
ncbi:MAG: SDR family oxidoreductase [Actinobacteria bacterium]|nr:MAG: SDR family oxidoreductase [Actinomycetota bacterium]